MRFRAAGAGMRASVGALAAVAAWAVLAPASLRAQVRLEGVVVTAGVSAEGYRGDLSSVTVLWTDSTESALAGTGEFSVRGDIVYPRAGREFRVGFRGNLRQFATGGFELRNYAPRESTGLVTAGYRQTLWGGWLDAHAGAESRVVADRPPMPLYLPPGFDSYTASVQYWRQLPANRYFQEFDVAIRAEDRDYAAPRVLPQLDLLDRVSGETTVGFTRHIGREQSVAHSHTLRVFSGLRYHTYPRKGLSIRRKDHAVQTGAEWEFDRRETMGLLLEASVRGTFSRSNSRRVEYNLASANAIIHKELGVNTVIVDLALADKSYLQPVQYLVPGEEVDNYSSVHAQLRRELGADIYGTFGLLWKNAETNIGGAYYRNFGVTFSMSVWPRF